MQRSASFLLLCMKIYIISIFNQKINFIISKPSDDNNSDIAKYRKKYKFYTAK